MKQKLANLVSDFATSLNDGNLDDASEATLRSWIDQLLPIFGWDPKNTNEVRQERTLDNTESKRLESIQSRHKRPDYTLVNGNKPLVYIDAKSLNVDIYNDKNAAFQIRSYGWSSGMAFSIITNFKEMAIYDCHYKPSISDSAKHARIIYLKYDEYVEKFHTLINFLEHDHVVRKSYEIRKNAEESVDIEFSKILLDFRIKLTTAIITENKLNVELETVSLWAQIIINRILFIRVCESRALEKQKLLQDFCNSEDKFWESFKNSSYLNFYDHYDGPMFERIKGINDLKISDNIFIELIEHLYYPSPYRFDVIPSKTLSDIYDLFLSHELKMQGNKITNTLRSEYKKSNGAITTPEHIVEKVIEKTFGDNLRNLSSSELLALKILDPACGSGLFLIKIYELLCDYYLKKLVEEHTESQDYITKGDRAFLTIDGKKRIINNCLYGVDINPEAIEVTKMSLSLKVIDDYEPIYYKDVGLLRSRVLQDVGRNIKLGNTLVETDFIDAFSNININEQNLTRMFSWEENFHDVMEKGGYDYVIGNPPYVEVKNYNVGLPTMSKYIKWKYSSSASGKVDLVIPFIEKGISLLNSKGRLGYIVQKRFFKTDYGKGIRRYLISNNLVNYIYDYLDNNLFYGRTTYVAILVCDKNRGKNKFIDYQSSNDKSPIKYPYDIFGETPWKFGDIELSNLISSLAKRHQRLQNVCNVKVGIQVLWDKAYHIIVDDIKDDILFGHSNIDDKIKIEKNACCPLVCNENFVALSKINYTTYAIFPYDVVDEISTPINFSEYSHKYPLAGEYLLKHKNKIMSEVETFPQKHAKASTDEEWHLYTRANNHGATYKKICVPMTAIRPMACVISDIGVYCDNANMFFIQVPNATDKMLYALSGIISSDIFMVLAKYFANPQRGGYMKFNKQFLDPIPIPKFDNHVDNLYKICKDIEELNIAIAKLGGYNDQHLITARNKKFEKLNDYVLSLYNITNEEKNIIKSRSGVV